MFKKLLVFLTSILSLFTGFSQCDNIFFSEYIEGSGNNRAIELYNPTPNAISLAGYRITMKGFNNAGAANSVFFNLNGTIPSKATYVLANDQADFNNIRSIADTIVPGGAGSIMNYTGDDALILSKSGVTIDAIGTRNAADRSQVDSPMLKDHTLIRKFNTDKGDTSDWLTSAKNSWDILGINSFSDLKNHNSNVCGSTIDTTIRFGVLSRTVDENFGVVKVPIRLNIANPTATTRAAVVLSSGDLNDVNFFIAYNIAIPANSLTDTLKITVTDDMIAEGKETLKFSLRLIPILSGNLKINKDSVFTLTINPSDNPPVELPISTVRGNNTNGIPDSMDKYPVILRGIVLGTDQDASVNGIRFTIYDKSTGTNGIQVNSNKNWNNYIVKEGDSVLVQGKIGNFNGLADIDNLDTFIKLGTSVAKAPRVVTNLNESTESDLVRLNNLTFVSGTWPGTDSSKTIIVKDGSGAQFDIRIQNTGGIFGSVSLFTGNFSIIGIGGQFDNAPIKSSGYQLMPRFKSDIISNPTSINSIEHLNSISIYPNPSNGLFRLKMDVTEIDQAKITIFNAALQTVITKSIQLEKGENIISFNQAISAGTYFVEVKTDSQVKTQKLIIQ